MGILARRHLRSQTNYGTIIPAGADIVSVISAGEVNERFILTATPSQPYRIAESLPMKSGQVLISKSGAVIKGSQIVEGWLQESGTGLWYKNIELTDYSNSSVQSNCTGYAHFILGEVDQAEKLQDTYLDGSQLKRYMVKSNLVSGGFYYDFSASRLFLFDEPNGHTVEVATTLEAVHAYNTISGCTIDGLSFQHFASHPQMSAVYIEANNWEVKNCEFSYNHSIGLKFAFVTSGYAHHNTVHHNGQLGISLYLTSGTLIEHNEISYQNYMGDFYALDWESGGIKYVMCDNSIFRQNNCHHNNGIGIWADTDNIALTFDANIVEDNESCGIRHETSFGAIISNNIVRRNGIGAINRLWRTKDPWTAGQGDYFAPIGSGFMTAGISINCSGGVQGDAMATIEVFGNTVQDNQNGIFLQQRNRGYSTTLPQRPFIVQHVHVYENIVRLVARPGDIWGWNATGFGQYENPPVGIFSDLYLTRDNHMHDNSYFVESASSYRFGGYNGTDQTYYQFGDYQSAGFDANSTCRVSE